MRKNLVRSKIISAIMIASLTVTSFAGDGVTFPAISVKAASDEGTIGVIYKSGGYDSSYDSQNAYTGNDLGCTYTKEKTTFKVWSPEATKVTLKRYATGSDGESGAKDLGTVEMTKGDKGVWSCTVEGDIVNTYYTYDTVIGGVTYKDAVDIYAKAVGVNGNRGMVVDLDSTDPDNWDEDYDSKREAMKISEISVWEVHIRDFSIDVSSGVSSENRGKYKAFTETGTTINGEGRVSTCVDYLKELGVTHVQLMPMYDYASVDETKVTTGLGSNYNWGYDPKNYNAPEGSYASDPYDGNVRIKEMKEMIQALHDAGIKVIMDVVYNHTYETRNSNFTKLMPDYYYKLDGSKYSNQSGCGNATRSTAAMYNKFMRESLLYWAEEYHIDGFRFDLMGIHDYNTMNQIRQDMDKTFGEDTIILYGEGWTATEADSDGAWKGNESKLDPDIGYFNDQIRDAIKGEHKFDGTIGLVQTNYTSGSYLEVGEKWPNNVFGGIMGSVGYTSGQWGMWRPFWSKSSNSVIAYCSAHDNLTLWDKLTEGFGKQYNSTDDKMLRMNKMAGAVTLVSHGGYFMQAGEEFARTKNGDDNSYASSDNVNKIDWTRVSSYSNIQKYYEGMLEIRQVFSGFEKEYTRSSDNWHPNGFNMEWLSTDATGISAFTMTNSVSGEWNKIGVIINNTTQDTTYKLGSGTWVVIADGNTAGLTKIAEYDGSSVKAAGKSVVVAVPKDTFDANPDVAKLLRKNQETNHAPTISIDTDSTIEVEPNSKVTIQVSAKDADGDKVTLSASDIPEGAEFDESTGIFTWDNAAKGTYTVTFTATDGTAKSSKEVTIKVSSATASLEELVAEIEAAGLSEDEFTEQVFGNLQTALDKANEVLGQSDASEEDYKKAYSTLQSAYDKVKEEKTARESLETYVATATKEIENADSSVDADLLKDAKEVLQEAEKVLSGTAKAMAYTFAQDNLTDSVNALATVETEAGIHVSTSFSNPYIYIWTGSGTSAKKLAGEWPGAALTKKDADGNYFYDLPAEGTYNVIINDGLTGKKQTQDLTGNEGSILITVAGSSSSTDDNGNAIYSAEIKKVSDGGSAPEITKESLNAVIETAKKYDSKDYTEESYEALETQITEAEKVAGDKDATQLIINQQARALRAAILSLVAVKEDVIDPTVSPTETTAPPEKTNEPTETPNTDATTEPGATDDAGKSPTPSASVKPSQTPDSSSTPSQTSSVTETTSPQSTDSLTPGTNVPGNVNTPTDSAVDGQVSDLKIKSVSCNPVLCQVVKKNVKISVAAEGGMGSQQYKFEIYKGSKLMTSSEYSGSNTFVYKASSAGTYTFKVYVKDENNVEVSKTKKFTFVSKALSLKISKRVAKKKVTLKAAASGGLKSYKYKYVIKNAKGKTVKKTGFVSKKKLIWKPTKKGTYKVTITVKDSTGTTKSKTLTVKKK